MGGDSGGRREAFESVCPGKELASWDSLLVVRSRLACAEQGAGPSGQWVVGGGGLSGQPDPGVTALKEGSPEEGYLVLLVS